MSHTKIAQLGESILRLKAKKVKNISSKKTQKFINKMLHDLKKSKGVGLAAPQIFKSLQLVIISSHPNERYPNAPLMKPTVMINPKIIKCSKKKYKDWEGCLSIPNIRALVPRYKKIKVRYTTPKGKTKIKIFKSFVARVFQHEYDHLIGLTFLDHVDSNKEIVSQEQYFKLLKKV